MVENVPLLRGPPVKRMGTPQWCTRFGLEGEALPLELHLMGCRKQRRHNEGVRRSQQIASSKRGAGGQGNSFTSEQNQPFPSLPPLGNELSGQISPTLFKMFGKRQMPTMKNCFLALKLGQNLQQLKADSSSGHY